MYKGSVGSCSSGSNVYPWLPNGREDVSGLLKCCSKLLKQSMGGLEYQGIIITGGTLSYRTK